MKDNLENLIKTVYKKYKADFPAKGEDHPNEEYLACFIESRLSPDERKIVKEHLLHCDFCAEALSEQIKIKSPKKVILPQDLILKMRNLIKTERELPTLSIILAVKEKIFELLNTNGDILVGQELMPAPLVRSRQIKEFKDEITVLKDFNNIRIEVKIENKGPNLHSLSVSVKDKQTSQVTKDLRITLLKDNAELESYITNADRIVFDQILTNKYVIEISDTDNKLGAISLEIKV